MTAASCVSTCTTIKQSAPASGYDDGFIAKYDGSGHLIRWTYFGGNGRDIIHQIVVDQSTHDVFVAGYTESTPSSFPSATSTYTPYLDNRGGDIFIAQFDSCLGTLKFLGFWTGSDYKQDRPHGLSIYDDGSDKYLVISGTTPSGTSSGFAFPTSGADEVWDHEYGGGSSDAFLMKWKKMSELTLGPHWCTYLGGSLGDKGRKNLVMPDGSIYIVGETLSYEDGLKFQHTSDALYQGDHHSDLGLNDGYIAKFNSNGTNRISFTFFGGNADDIIMDINLYHSNPNASNNHDSIAIAGLTTSYSTGSNPGPIPLYNASIVSDKIDGDGNNPGKDAFFSVVTGTGEGANSQIVSFSSYIGGTGDEAQTLSYGPAIALGTIGSEYIALATKSSNIQSICQVNSQIGTYSGNQDVYIGKIFPFVQRYCPTCSPCKLAGDDNSDGSPLIAYPIPFDELLHVQLNSVTESEAIINAYNMLGEIVLAQKIIVIHDWNTVTLNFEGKPSGIYLLKVEFDGKIQEAIVVKE